LDSGTRDTFHIELRKILDELAILNKNSPDINSKTSQSNKLLKIPTNIDDQDSKIIGFQLATSLFSLSVVVKHMSFLKK
jgi:hypothetical protein